MAEIPDDILSILKKYINYLENNGYPIQTAFIYGSYAKGTYDKWSDIDIALVSEKFKGVRFLDKEKLLPITYEVDYQISPLPYRPEDFSPDNLFVQEILKTGIRIV